MRLVDEGVAATESHTAGLLRRRTAPPNVGRYLPPPAAVAPPAKGRMVLRSSSVKRSWRPMK